MGKEIVLFKSEEKKDRQSAAAFLHQLADKLTEGQVVLIQGQEKVTLDIPANVVLEIKAEEEAKKKGTHFSLEVEIEWVPGDEKPESMTLG
jgi:amphi-Trp domain-containing protein